MCRGVQLGLAGFLLEFRTARARYFSDSRRLSTGTWQIRAGPTVSTYALQPASSAGVSWCLYMMKYSR